MGKAQASISLSSNCSPCNGTNITVGCAVALSNQFQNEATVLFLIFHQSRPLNTSCCYREVAPTTKDGDRLPCHCCGASHFERSCAFVVLCKTIRHGPKQEGRGVFVLSSQCRRQTLPISARRGLLSGVEFVLVCLDMSPHVSQSNLT